jgi:hypothetical protein
MRKTCSPAFRELAVAELAANLYRRTETAEDARRIACRLVAYEDLVSASLPSSGCSQGVLSDVTLAGLSCPRALGALAVREA